MVLLVEQLTLYIS